MINDKMLKKMTGGKLFSMVYKREDGTIGKLVGRFGVKKFLKNKEQAVSFAPSAPKDYVNVFDVRKNRYNRRPIKTIISITQNGVTLTLADISLIMDLNVFTQKMYIDTVKKSGPKKNGKTEYVTKASFRYPKFSELVQESIYDYSQSEMTLVA